MTANHGHDGPKPPPIPAFCAIEAARIGTIESEVHDLKEAVRELREDEGSGVMEIKDALLEMQRKQEAYTAECRNGNHEVNVKVDKLTDMLEVFVAARGFWTVSMAIGKVVIGTLTVLAGLYAVLTFIRTGRWPGM